MELKALHADGEVVVTEFTVRGTHNGTWAGIDPTGEWVEADLRNITEFKDGNAVCPGYICTPMVEPRLGQIPGFEDQLASRHALGRLGTAEEVAEAVVWLCPDAASLSLATC